MSSTYDQYFEANKHLWNKRTAINKDSSFYDRAGFIKGNDAITEIEKNEVGDIQGKKILHLQCHFGMDSLNLVRMGAEVTGVDFSAEAIREARLLSEECGLPARFICCNIYDLPGQLDETFDMVFTTFGVVGWLPDLKAWASLVAKYLKPGGIFYLAEFHPVIWMFDDAFTHIQYCYENREVIETEIQGTYSDRSADIKAKEYGWNHSISEVLNNLLENGLAITRFNEYMYSPYPCFSNVVSAGDRRWWIKGLEDKIPMVYTVTAVKVK